MATHAKDRLKERGITFTQIEAAIFAPDIKMPGTQPKTHRVHKMLTNGRNIQVIYKAKGSTFLVITAAWRD